MADNKKPVDSSGLKKDQPHTHLQDTLPSGDLISEVQTATCFVDDRVAFLQRIRTVAESFDTHIICLNAGMLAAPKIAKTVVPPVVKGLTNVGGVVQDVRG